MAEKLTIAGLKEKVAELLKEKEALQDAIHSRMEDVHRQLVDRIADLENRCDILLHRTKAENKRCERAADLLRPLRMPDPMGHLRLLTAIAELTDGVVDLPRFLAQVDAGWDEAEKKYDVILVQVGERKIDVIKAIREITTLELKEAKDLTDCVPSVIVRGALKDRAEECQKMLEAAGATVEIR